MTHEEADIIIAHHVVHIARETSPIIHIVCDDTDVFMLLVYFYSSEDLRSDVFMVPTRTSRSAVNIGATAKEQEDIAKYLLPMHALTGCDTVKDYMALAK